jgi:hypothetical protein
VLASIELNLKTADAASGTNLGITQFFATGSAARNLARHPDIQAVFNQQATTAISASVQKDVAETVRQETANYNLIARYFRNAPSAGFMTARDKLLADANIPAASPRGRALRAKSTADDFLKYLRDADPSLIAPLAHSTRRLGGPQ